MPFDRGTRKWAGALKAKDEGVILLSEDPPGGIVFHDALPARGRREQDDQALQNDRRVASIVRAAADRAER